MCLPVGLLRWTTVLVGLVGVALAIATLVIGINQIDKVRDGIGMAQQDPSAVDSTKNGFVGFGSAMILICAMTIVCGLMQSKILLYCSNFFYVIFFIVYATILAAAIVGRQYYDDNLSSMNDCLKNKDLLKTQGDF